MKKIITILAVMFTSTVTFADGWECYEIQKGPVVAKVYNYTNPSNGTRTASTMILSDRTVSEGRQTIATFNNWQNNLVSEGANYTAQVDKRFSNIKDGELIPNSNGEGAKLGNVETVSLEVNFQYGEQLRDGDRRKGVLTVVKRDSDYFQLDMYCYRYLKGE